MKFFLKEWKWKWNGWIASPHFKEREIVESESESTTETETETEIGSKCVWAE